MNPPVPTPGSSCNWRARKCRCSDPAISAPHRPGQPARASCAARCASVRPSARSARPRAVCSSQRQSDAPHGRRFRRPPTLRGACSSGRICWISAGSAHCSTVNSSRAIWSSSIGACGSAAPEVCRPSICLQRRAEPGLLLPPLGEGWDGGFRVTVGWDCSVAAVDPLLTFSQHKKQVSDQRCDAMTFARQTILRHLLQARLSSSRLPIASKA